MRICVVSPTVGRNDGQGRVNLEIALEAHRQGHDVVILTERVDGAPAWLAERAKLLRPPSWLKGRLLRDQLFAWRTGVILRQDRAGCDVVLANGFVTWAAADVNAVHFVHASWLASAHHPWRLRPSARSLYARLYSFLNVRLERWALRRATRVVAVSGGVASDLRRMGVPESRLSIIPNGVDIDEFRPGPEQRSALGLPEAVALGLFAGDMKSPRKNLDTVLRALADAPELHLAVVGTEAGELYREMARDLGVGNRVHFLGFRGDMPALMRAANLLVFPSRYEPCGLVILEALASGTAVVTTRNVGGSDIVAPGAGVVLEDCEDAAALAECLRSLCADPDRMRVMGIHARESAERLDWSLMAQRYLDLLGDTARARSSRAYRADKAPNSRAPVVAGRSEP